MTGEDFRLIRIRLKLSRAKWAGCLGYEGPHAEETVRRYEYGGRPVPTIVATLAIMFEKFGVPADILDDATSKEAAE